MYLIWRTQSRRIIKVLERINREFLNLAEEKADTFYIDRIQIWKMRVIA